MPPNDENDEIDVTFGESISDLVYRFGGSWWFIITGAIAILLWVVVNVIPFFKWDDYPFILLNLFLSLIAAFQAPFILMAQRLLKKTQALKLSCKLSEENFGR